MLARLINEHDHILKTLNLLEMQFLDLCRGGTLDYALMRSIIVYIEEYPEQAHHPLEDLIFSILLKRVHNNKFVQKLITEHTELETVTRELRDSLESLNNGTVVIKKLRRQLSTFLIMQRQHIYTEEARVFPLINSTLTERDWRHIKSIFTPIDDPVFGKRTRSDYELLYHEIENKSF